jgi:hypothetical protein
MVKSLARGIAAGIAGTAAMTGYQLAVAKARGKPLGTPAPHRWADAPAPAQVAKKVAELVPLGIYEDPWKTPPAEFALDLSYHVVYGLAVAGDFAALDRPGATMRGRVRLAR